MLQIDTQEIFLKLNSAPNELNFALKGAGFYGVFFYHEESTDGMNYTNLGTYIDASANCENQTTVVL
jgi:hypothetical protein